MAAPLDPTGLPPALRRLTERALRAREGHEIAIEAIERHLDAGGERTPALLVALAALTYDDAAAVVLHELGWASGRAISLLDEAELRGGSRRWLRPLRDAFESAQTRERERERRLRLGLLSPERARPAELAELARRLGAAGDDHGERVLMGEAARRAERGPAPHAPAQQARAS